MKKTLRRICSFMLVIAMVLALCPTFLQNVYAEDGDTVVSPDEVVIATTEYNEESSENYCNYQNNTNLFYEVAAEALSEYASASDVKFAVEEEGTTVTLKYGDVKDIVDFTISADSEVYSLYMIETLLPNLENISIYSYHLVYNGNGIDYVPETVKSVTVNAHRDSDNQDCGYCTIALSDMSNFSNLETLNISVDCIDFYEGFNLPGGLKNLSLVATEYSNCYGGESEVVSIINGLINLGKIDLSGQTFAKNVDFAGFSELTSLILNSCGFDSATFPELTGCSGLEVLSIAGNNELPKEVALKKVPVKFAEDTAWVDVNFTDVNEAVTTGDKESAYYVPDQNLYAVLLNDGDRDRDGILTVGEAAAITNLYGYYNYKVESFTGLSTVAPNITNMSISRDDAEWDNYYAEISKLSHLEWLDVSLKEQDEIADVFNLVGLRGLDISMYGMKNIDISGISSLTNLESLYIYAGYEDVISGVSGLNNLSELSGLSIYADNFSFSDLSEKLLGQLIRYNGYISNENELNQIYKMTSVSSLSISFTGDSKYEVDLSNLNDLHDITLNGSFEKITLPASAEYINSIDINNSISGFNFADESKLATLVNLDKYSKVITDDNGWQRGLGYLKISGCNIGDLSDIKDMRLLYNLYLYNCNITSTEEIGNLTNLSSLTISGNYNLTSIDAGIGNLTNLNYLTISNNFNLTSIDEGIGNITNLKNLNLGYNGLTTLPDLSALCNEEGLLSPLWDNETYSGRVTLAGNELTEEAVKASKLDDKFLKDSNWMMDATSRKYITEYGSIGIYYTNLTSAFMWKQMEDSYGSSFRTDKSVVLNSEFVSYIKSEKRTLYIDIIDVDSDYTIKKAVRYYVSPYYLDNWTSGDISLNNLDETYTKDTGSYGDLLSGTVYGYVEIPADVEVTPYASTSLYIYDCFDSNTSYSVFEYDGTNIKHSGSSGMNSNSVYINLSSSAGNNKYNVFVIASVDARIYNDTFGAYCENELVPLSNFGIVESSSWVDSEWVVNDWQDSLCALIDGATSGSAITIAVTDGRATLSNDTIKKLADKKIKLTVYSGWIYGADYFSVNCVTTMDFGKTSESVLANDCMSIYRYSLNLYEQVSDYYPGKLFNGAKYSPVWSSIASTVKSYVGSQFTNGTKLYLYRTDYANNQLVLEDECTVSYGCAEINLQTTDTYYLSNTKLTETKWTNTSSGDDIGNATGGDAKPDDEDKPDNGDKPDDGDKPDGGDKTDDVSKPAEDSKPDESEVVVDKCADGHTWEYKTVTEATCTEAGVGVKTCSVCGKQEEYEIPARGHIWNSAYTIDKSATATEDGSKSIHCLICGESNSDSVVVIEKYGVEVILPTIEATEITSEFGVHSAPSTVDQTKIVSKSEAVTTLINKMTETIAPKVEVYTTGVIPTMTSDLFTAAADNNKDITIGAVNENNQLVYSWTFDYDSIDTSKVPEGGLNLAITFETEKQAEIESITGQTNAVYISIDGYHGELPGPAKVKTYVGDKYKNGEIVYLYYYNEESKRVELVGNSGLKVNEGYVEYTLTHCSTYFVSEDEPAKYGIETIISSPETTPSATATPTVAAAPAPAKASPKTGDTFPFIPLACVIAGLSIVGYVISFRKKEII